MGKAFSCELVATSKENDYLFNLFMKLMSIFSSSSRSLKISFSSSLLPKLTAFAINNCVSSSKLEPSDISMNLEYPFHLFYFYLQLYLKELTLRMLLRVRKYQAFLLWEKCL